MHFFSAIEYTHISIFDNLKYKSRPLFRSEIYFYFSSVAMKDCSVFCFGAPEESITASSDQHQRLGRPFKSPRRRRTRHRRHARHVSQHGLRIQTAVSPAAADHRSPNTRIN